MNTKRLQDLIFSSKISKSELSLMSGVSRTTLDNILSGSDFKVSTLESLSAVLNVSPAVFFDAPGNSAVASGNNSIAAVNSSVCTDYRALWLDAQLIIKEKDALISKLVTKLCSIESTP